MLGKLLNGVSLANLSSAKEIIEKNQAAFYKIITKSIIWLRV